MERRKTLFSLTGIISNSTIQNVMVDGHKCVISNVTNMNQNKRGLEKSVRNQLHHFKRTIKNKQKT